MDSSSSADEHTPYPTSITSKPSITAIHLNGLPDTQQTPDNKTNPDKSRQNEKTGEERVNKHHKRRAKTAKNR